MSRGAVFQTVTKQVCKTDVGLTQMTHIQAAQVVTISTIKRAKTKVKRMSHRKPLKSKSTVGLTSTGPLIVKSEGEVVTAAM